MTASAEAPAAAVVMACSKGGREDGVRTHDGHGHGDGVELSETGFDAVPRWRGRASPRPRGSCAEKREVIADGASRCSMSVSTIAAAETGSEAGGAEPRLMAERSTGIGGWWLRGREAVDGEGVSALLSHASDLDGAHHLDAGGTAGAKAWRRAAQRASDSHAASR